jgi:hypothetical protein
MTTRSNQQKSPRISSGINTYRNQRKKSASTSVPPEMGKNFHWTKAALEFLSSYFLHHEDDYRNNRTQCIQDFVKQCNKKQWNISENSTRSKINSLIGKGNLCLRHLFSLPTLTNIAVVNAGENFPGQANFKEGLFRKSHICFIKMWPLLLINWNDQRFRH